MRCEVYPGWYGRLPWWVVWYTQGGVPLIYPGGVPLIYPGGCIPPYIPGWVYPSVHTRVVVPLCIPGWWYLSAYPGGVSQPVHTRVVYLSLYIPGWVYPSVLYPGECIPLCYTRVWECVPFIPPGVGMCPVHTHGFGRMLPVLASRVWENVARSSLPDVCNSHRFEQKCAVLSRK